MEVQDNPALEPAASDNPATEPEQDESTAESVFEAESPEDEAPPSEQPKFKVKLAGKEVEVELDELLSGYSRQADYTAKTQAVAAKERELAEQARQFETARQAEVTRIQSAIQAAAAALQYDVQNINWDDLLQNNPQQYLIEQRKVQQRQQQIQTALAEQQRLQSEIAAKRKAETRTTLEREQSRMLDLIPEWKDETKRAAEQTALVQWATKQGFDPDVLSSVVHARDVVTLRKAYLYDQMMAKVPAAKTATAAPPPPPPAPTKAKSSPDPDKMSMEQWVKWREADLKRKRAG